MLLFPNQFAELGGAPPPSSTPLVMPLTSSSLVISSWGAKELQCVIGTCFIAIMGTMAEKHHLTLNMMKECKN